jgi:hypothetical protein
LDVKSTDGEFNQRIFVSIGELRQMAFGKERYDIYRVFNIENETARLRIHRDVRDLAKEVLDIFGKLPLGVIPHNVSISPSSLRFDSEIILAENSGKT